MQAVDRKLLRDLSHMKGQVAAITLVVACGIANFVAALSTWESLKEAQRGYYERQRFADVFAPVKRAPESLSGRIADIPGVTAVQTRIVKDVSLDIEHFAEPVNGRLISIPEDAEPALNGLHLRSGRTIRPGYPDEILASEAFALAHDMRPGDSFRAVINGRKRRLEIVGVALSPEYVYQIGSAEALPDDKHFGVFWMGRQAMEAAFDMKSAFNDIVLKLAPGAPQKAVIEELDDLLEPWGGLGAYGREDQVSDRYLSTEIESLRLTGLIVPLVFLGVAAFLLNVVLTRLISTQREQIAMLKAFGYSDFAVGWHYFQFVLLVDLLGSALGVLLGAWVGKGMTGMYTEFYHFPSLDYFFPPWVAGAAVAVSVAASLFGAVGAVSRASALPPAEAMRPEPPPSFKPTLVEKLGVFFLLSTSGRMILRNIARRPGRALLTITGIAFSVAILVLGMYFKDSLDFMLDLSFNRIQREDVMVTFVGPMPDRTRRQLGHIEGVQYVEGFRAVPARLRNGHLTELTAITGLEKDARLRKLLNRDLTEEKLPDDGVVLTLQLAKMLGVEVGDTLDIEVLEGARPRRSVAVVGTVDELVGVFAYMRIDALNHLMREGHALSGAYLSIDSDRTDDIYRRLKNTPGVAGITIRKASREAFESTIADNMLIMTGSLVIFAAIIAFGVVYNTARISLSERARELASLRVLGFTRGEISTILLGELAALTLVSLPVGFLLGYLMAHGTSAAYDSELYRIPVVISNATYGFAAAIVLASAAISGLLVRRRLDHLDLVAVLKTRE